MIGRVTAQFSGLLQIEEAGILLFDEPFQLFDAPIDASCRPFCGNLPQLRSLGAKVDEKVSGDHEAMLAYSPLAGGGRGLLLAEPEARTGTLASSHSSSSPRSVQVSVPPRNDVRIAVAGPSLEETAPVVVEDGYVDSCSGFEFHVGFEDLLSVIATCSVSDPQNRLLPPPEKSSHPIPQRSVRHASLQLLEEVLDQDGGKDDGGGVCGGPNGTVNLSSYLARASGGRDAPGRVRTTWKSWERPERKLPAEQSR